MEERRQTKRKITIERKREKLNNTWENQVRMKGLKYKVNPKANRFLKWSIMVKIWIDKSVRPYECRKSKAANNPVIKSENLLVIKKEISSWIQFYLWYLAWTLLMSGGGGLIVPQFFY